MPQNRSHPSSPLQTKFTQKEDIINTQQRKSHRDIFLALFSVLNSFDEDLNPLNQETTIFQKWKAALQVNGRHTRPSDKIQVLLLSLQLTILEQDLSLLRNPRFLTGKWSELHLWHLPPNGRQINQHNTLKHLFKLLYFVSDKS